MGTWLGHAAPGTYFLVFSIWWFVRTMQEYNYRQGNYRNTAGKSCCCGRLHMEAVVLILTALSGILAEIITGMLNDSYVPLGNIQHLTMYTAFGLCGVIEILLSKNVAFLPKKSDYMAVIVALIVEMVLFVFHLHGREDVDKHLHMLLVYSIGGCILATALEMYFDKSVQAAMARSYFFMLQGSWFITMGFLLYNPFPSLGVLDLKNKENVMVTTLVYAWHMIICLLFCLLLSGLAHCCMKANPRSGGGGTDEHVRMSLLPNYKDTGDMEGGSRDSLRAGYNSVDEEEDSLYVASTKPHNSHQ